MLECPILEADLTVDDLFFLLHDNGPITSASEEGSNRTVHSVDERKRRRMISNRESARRSRWRKKRHLEGLNDQLNQLRVENRVLKNRLGQVAHRCHVALTENDRLSSEFLTLDSRLSDLLRILHARAAFAPIRTPHVSH